MYPTDLTRSELINSAVSGVRPSDSQVLLITLRSSYTLILLLLASPQPRRERAHHDDKKTWPRFACIDGGGGCTREPMTAIYSLYLCSARKRFQVATAYDKGVLPSADLLIYSRTAGVSSSSAVHSATTSLISRRTGPVVRAKSLVAGNFFTKHTHGRCHVH